MTVPIGRSGTGRLLPDRVSITTNAVEDQAPAGRRAHVWSGRGERRGPRRSTRGRPRRDPADHHQRVPRPQDPRVSGDRVVWWSDDGVTDIEIKTWTPRVRVHADHAERGRRPRSRDLRQSRGLAGRRRARWRCGRRGLHVERADRLHLRRSRANTDSETMARVSGEPHRVVRHRRLPTVAPTSRSSTWTPWYGITQVTRNDSRARAIPASRATGSPGTRCPTAATGRFFTATSARSRCTASTTSRTARTSTRTRSSEAATCRDATWPHIYRFEGEAYYTNPANNAQPLYRFYNVRNGSHFYTASATEATHVIATWPSIFAYDGPTYLGEPRPGRRAASRSTASTTCTNGSHFYTASAERGAIT